MIQSRRLGDAVLTRVCEYYGPTHDPAVLFPDYDPAILQSNADWLVPNHWYPAMNRLVITIQLWVVHAGSNIIVVDTGVGNRKSRLAPRMSQLNTLVPVWLEAAGAAPDKVTHVVMTHLHPDHIGWNTSLVDGRFVPTFPNARYLAPSIDFEIFRDLHRDGSPVAEGFDDSIMPLLEGGLFDLIEGPEVADCLEVEDAVGHTPGQLNFRLRSGGEQGVFSADVMHHPIQIVQPEWNTRYCMVPDAAKTTRLRFLNEAADSGALFMPMHFGPPSCGYIRRQRAGFEFEPARWPE